MDPILSDLRDNLQNAFAAPIQLAQKRNRELRETQALERQDRLVNEERTFTSETASNLANSRMAQIEKTGEIAETAASKLYDRQVEAQGLAVEAAENQALQERAYKQLDAITDQTRRRDDLVHRLKEESNAEVAKMDRKAQLQAAIYLGTDTMDSEGKPRAYNEIVNDNKKSGVQFLVDLEMQKRTRMKKYLLEVEASRDAGIVGGGWVAARRSAVQAFAEDPGFRRILIEKYPNNWKEKLQQLTLPLEKKEAITLETIIGEVMEGGYFRQGKRNDKGLMITELFHPYLKTAYEATEDASVKKEMMGQMNRMKDELQHLKAAEQESKILHPYRLLAREKIRQMDKEAMDAPPTSESMENSVLRGQARMAPHYQENSEQENSPAYADPLAASPEGDPYWPNGLTDEERAASDNGDWTKYNQLVRERRGLDVAGETNKKLDLDLPSNPDPASAPLKTEEELRAKKFVQEDYSAIPEKNRRVKEEGVRQRINEGKAMEISELQEDKKLMVTELRRLNNMLDYGRKPFMSTLQTEPRSKTGADKFVDRMFPDTDEGMDKALSRSDVGSGIRKLRIGHPLQFISPIGMFEKLARKTSSIGIGGTGEKTVPLSSKEKKVIQERVKQLQNGLTQIDGLLPGGNADLRWSRRVVAQPSDFSQ